MEVLYSLFFLWPGESHTTYAKRFFLSFFLSRMFLKRQMHCVLSFMSVWRGAAFEASSSEQPLSSHRKGRSSPFFPFLLILVNDAPFTLRRSSTQAVCVLWTPPPADPPPFSFFFFLFVFFSELHFFVSPCLWRASFHTKPAFCFIFNRIELSNDAETRSLHSDTLMLHFK